MFYSCLSLCVLGLVSTSGRAAAQTSSAAWQFPVLENDGMTVNYIDTIVLQWTSNYPTAWLNFWCQNGTTGNNVTLGLLNRPILSGRHVLMLISGREPIPSPTIWKLSIYYVVGRSKSIGISSCMSRRACTSPRTTRRE